MQTKRLALAALAFLLLALGGSVPALSPARRVPPRSPEDAGPVVLDYTGSMNCESDLWNNENYLDAPGQTGPTYQGPAAPERDSGAARP
jgi:hypothetical protein